MRVVAQLGLSAQGPPRVCTLVLASLIAAARRCSAGNKWLQV